MLITEKLVFLNFPKTGSSFVRTVIKEIYNARIHKSFINKFLSKTGFIRLGYTEILMPHLNIPEFKDQHGTYHQIPNEYTNKKVISVIRNPYDRFLSLYKFKWWATNPLVSNSTLEKHVPNFPNLTIDEFVLYDQQLTNKFKLEYNIPPSVNIGGQTIEFIEMFFKNPTHVLNNITNEYLENDSYKNDLNEIYFLQQENLNIDLAELLESENYSKKEIEVVKNYKKINVTATNPMSDELSQSAKEYILSTEKLLFKILKNKGIVY